MNRIRANLRMALSQPWAVWSLFAIAVGVFGLLVLLEACSDWFAGLMLSDLWGPAVVLCRLALRWHEPGDITEKPISFLLPGYRETLRRSSFARAVRWGVLVSLWLFSFSWQRQLFYWESCQIWSGLPGGVPADVSLPVKPGALEMSLTLAGGFLAWMATCLLWTCGSLIEFRRPWLGTVSRVLGFALPTLLIGTEGIRHPYIVWPILMPLSLVFCVYFWVHLGDRDWVKSGHRALIVGKIEQPRGIVVQVNSQRYVAQMRFRRRVEKLFLDRMRQANVNALGRSVWAWLYCTFGPTLPYWRWITASLLIGVVVQGYVSRLLVELVCLVLGGLVAAGALPAMSSLLLGEGRRQKYHLTVVAAVFTTLVLVTIFTAVMTLSWVFAAVMPPISWGTHHWRYAGIGMSSLWLVCLPVPWIFLASPIWQRVPMLRAALTVVVAFLVIGELCARDYGLYNGPTLLRVLLACGWALLPLTLWITYRRWDLVGQRPLREA
jgi:hypothetical protein